MAKTSSDIDTNIPNLPRLQGSADEQNAALRRHHDDIAERMRVALETIREILADNGM